VILVVFVLAIASCETSEFRRVSHRMSVINESRSLRVRAVGDLLPGLCVIKSAMCVQLSVGSIVSGTTFFFFLLCSQSSPNQCTVIHEGVLDSLSLDVGCAGVIQLLDSYQCTVIYSTEERPSIKHS
jgi:hypothetical protein